MPAVLELDRLLQPTADELAAATLFGADARATSLPTVKLGPRQALEHELGRLLARPLPVFVEFSGGRDSSALLAIAAHVARRDGLPLPIPLTYRYPRARDAHEDQWQSLVLGHLGLPEREVVDPGDRHEGLGPAALAELRRHGPQANPLWWTHRLPPQLGGAEPAGDAPVPGPPVRAILVNGFGGDQVLAGDAGRPWLTALRGRRRPPAAGWRAVGFEALPHALRARRMAVGLARDHDWIVAGGERALLPLARDLTGGPLTLAPYLELLHADRDMRGVLAHTRVAALESGAEWEAPFLAPTVLAAMRAASPVAFRSRTRWMHELVGDLLPRELLERSTKADFTGAFIGSASAAWLDGWSGDGIPDGRIDGRIVRRRLLAAAQGKPGGDARALPLAQAAMLRISGR